MSKGQTHSTAVALTCSECGVGNYYTLNKWDAQCDKCGHVVNVARDIEPWLDPTEKLFITDTDCVSYITLED